MAQNVDIVPGPVDDRVLYDQKHHISQTIWNNNSEHVKQIHNHNQSPFITHPGVLDYVRRAGFYGLYHLLFVKIDNPLMTALVERWRPETHTFHFPVGELTITLQDIEVLAGVKVDGRPLVRSEAGESDRERKNRVTQLLGREPSIGDYSKQGLLSCKWLAENFDPRTLPANAEDVTVQQFARASILRLLGSQYLQDMRGSHVQLYYLPFLEDLDLCGTYSWGSAILAFLYRSLCKASSRGIDGIHGALILLQFWAWSRLRQVCPCDVLEAEERPVEGWPRYPYGRRWASTPAKYNVGGICRNLRAYREEFDTMSIDQVIWEPYKDVLRGLPEYCTASRAIWRARVPLICVDIVEWHFPDRVMRQFGMRQNVPQDAERDDRLHKKSRKGNPGCDWVTRYAKFIFLWDSRHQRVESSEIHNGQQTMADDYMDWYERITRRWIGNIITCPPPRGIQPKAALMEVMLQGLRKSYELFYESGHEEGVQHLKQVFATIGVQPPVAKLLAPDFPDDADVAENAEVSENAEVAENANVTENADVAENAIVTENAIVAENADVADDVEMADDADEDGMPS